MTLEQKQAFNKKLSNIIKNGQWNAFASELTTICGIIILGDLRLDDEFINKIKDNKLETYGANFEIRSSGKAYMVDWKGQQKEDKEIITCSGKKVKVEYVICDRKTDAQVPKTYRDYLSISEDKSLTIFISHDEAKKTACGDETYAAIISMLENKLTDAVREHIYDAILCMINDLDNYKKIETLTYCSCKTCDGTTLLGSLNKFALKLQRNTSDYNLAGRDYTLPVNDQWLITNYDLDSTISDIVANTFHENRSNPISKFGYYHYLDLAIADAIIIDKRWIQYREMSQDVSVENVGTMRGQCSTINYIARRKAINHLVAVPIKFKKVKCDDVSIVDNIIADLQDIGTIDVADNKEASAIAALKVETDKIDLKEATLKIEILNFVEPTENKKGFIFAKFTIEKNSVKEIVERKIKLNLKRGE